MKRVFVPTRTGSDWQRLLAKPSLHWKKGYSAMCAAASWEAAGDRLPGEIQSALDQSSHPALNGLQMLAAIPEWQVALPGGDRASCTDVLAITRNESGVCVLGVEAKADEDFGPTLADKRKGASAGQLERIAFLETELGTQFSDAVRYQLLHRTFSALKTARDFHAASAVMLIHSFGRRPELRNDYERFCTDLGAAPGAGAVRAVDRFHQPALFIAWVDGDSSFRETELAHDPEFRSTRFPD